VLLCRRNMFCLCCWQHTEQLDYVWICLRIILKWISIDEDWICPSFKRSWKCSFRLYMRSLEESVGFRKLKNFTAVFHLWCPIEVIRIEGIKSGYTHVYCNSLKYCTIQYLDFVEIKLWTEVFWVITQAMWKTKVACPSDSLVATYIILIQIFIAF